MSGRWLHVPERPRVVNADGDELFRRICADRGWDPDAPDVGGYASREWDKVRHLFDGLFGFHVHGQVVLEVGCHLGGTSVVLAELGARLVIGFDPDEASVMVARANVWRHGVEDRVQIVRARYVDDLRLSGGSVDAVSLISVLEYVPARERPGLLRAVDRVLRPGGHVVVSGSTNRLYPREGHGGSWANWVPRRLDPLVFSDGEARRGITLREVRRGLPGYADLGLEPYRLAELKRRTGWRGTRTSLVRAATRALAPLGMHAGDVLPNVVGVFRKPEGLS